MFAGRMPWDSIGWSCGGVRSRGRGQQIRAPHDDVGWERGPPLILHREHKTEMVHGGDSFGQNAALHRLSLAPLSWIGFSERLSQVTR